MSNIDRFSIVTLIFFFLSTTFVIRPLSVHVRLPRLGRTKITIGLMTAPIMTIAILWAAQCLGPTQIRNGIVGTGKDKILEILYYALKSDLDQTTLSRTTSCSFSFRWRTWPSLWTSLESFKLLHSG